MNPHLHKFKFDCNDSGSHKHRLLGYTENMIGINALHFHHFFGISSYTGHTHYYHGFTGMPVKTANGHVHNIEGTFEVTNLHEHIFSSQTFEDVSYNSDKSAKKVFV